jgi:hypothetical protein
MRNARTGQGAPKRLALPFIGNSGKTCIQFTRHGRKRVGIAATDNGHNFEPIGMCAHNIGNRTTDGTCGSQNDETFDGHCGGPITRTER